MTITISDEPRTLKALDIEAAAGQWARCLLGRVPVGGPELGGSGLHAPFLLR